MVIGLLPAFLGRQGYTFPNPPHNFLVLCLLVLNMGDTDEEVETVGYFDPETKTIVLKEPEETDE